MNLLHLSPQLEGGDEQPTELPNSIQTSGELSVTLGSWGGGGGGGAQKVNMVCGAF